MITQVNIDYEINAFASDITIPGFVFSSLDYDASQNLYLSLSTVYFNGDDLDEYWYYSSAGYLTFE